MAFDATGGLIGQELDALGFLLEGLGAAGVVDGLGGDGKAADDEQQQEGVEEYDSSDIAFDCIETWGGPVCDDRRALARWRGADQARARAAAR